MKLKRMFRAASADGATLDKEARTVEFSFSSEYPVDRWFGKEILSHQPGAADLARLNDGGVLLWNHDMDRVLGVIESADIRDGKGFVKARFSKSEEADQKFNEVADGILRNVSFGYRVHEMERVKSSKETGDEFLATRWEPFEVSIVSIPADPTVGLGRTDTDEEHEVHVKNPETTQGEKREMPTEAEIAEMKKQEQAKRDAEMVSVRDEARKAERERVAAITALGDKFDKRDLSRQLVESGKTVDEARAAFLEVVGTGQRPVTDGAALLDLSDKEKRSYSLLNAIRASITGDWKGAGFERELSQEIAKRTGKETSGFFMPMNVKMDGTRAGSAGSYQAGSATLGGNLIQTTLLADSFIELLRNKMMVMQLGAKVLSGLVGNIAIPKQTGAATAYWVSELADVTESEGTFGQVTMSPKTVGARSQMSRQMMMQGTPDVEMLVRSDLASVIALAIDAACIAGTNSGGQPKGILNQSGIGSVAMGTNGAALTNIDPLIDLETSVATANADLGNLAYLTNAKQVGIMKKLKTTTNEYLWNGYEASVKAGVPGEVNGYQVGRSNQVPSNLTKGTASGICSALIFGNWSDLIVGQWGPGVEILANPFGAGFNNGGVDIRALASVDVAVRNAASFAAITDLL